MTASALASVSSILETMSSPEWRGVWEKTEFLSIIIIGLGVWGEGYAEHHIFSDSFASPTPVKSQKDAWCMCPGSA
jgi:hypothetical protein